MEKNYKVVATIEFPDGKEEFVLWEPELYGQMVYRNVDMVGLFYNTDINGFKDPPVSVLIELWENPYVKKIGSKIEGNEQIVDLLVGKRVLPIRQF